MGVIIVQETVQHCNSTRCGGVLNGGCEDICLPHKNDVKCECTQGVLDKSGKRCLKRHQESSCNETIEFECDSGDCIPFDLTCDTIPHCLDSSDENLNYCATRRCPFENFYQCVGYSWKCIPKKQVCDGVKNCGMGDDEENCPCKPDTEFKCGTGECIPSKFVCDFDPDCRYILYKYSFIIN